MADVVLKFRLTDAAEADAFGAYVFDFVENRMAGGERAAAADAPYIMIRSEPLPEAELRTVVFEEAGFAALFTDGWRRRRPALRPN